MFYFTNPYSQRITMSNRIPDVVLADQFTATTHPKATANIDPANNPLPTGLTVLIVGAARGIGAGIASAYAQAGAATLILTARASSMNKLAEVKATVQQINPKTRVVCAQVDVASHASVISLADKVRNEVGHLDILILNSGYSGPVVTKMTDGSPRDFQDVFDVNVQGMYLLAHYFVPLLIESEGGKTFFVVGSFASCIVRGHIANTAYCVSKFAQARLVEMLAEQFGNEEDGGLICVGVHPGAVLTEMADLTTPDSFRKCEFAPASILRVVVWTRS
jgi:NAD(P)-dependent dehydrogenase (short-subunit alcohol dehydrogenase family)